MPVKEPQPQQEDSLFAAVKPSKLKVWHSFTCTLYVQVLSNFVFTINYAWVMVIV